MAVHARPDETASAEMPPDGRPEVTCCDGRPGRKVFIEAGNTDGWIATDLTVEIPE